MPRWLLLAFAILVAVAIGHDLWSEANRTEPTFYEALRADEFAEKEAAAVILARAHAQDAFTAQTCATGGCDDPAKKAAALAAHDTLISGGCIDWEMSEFDPSRGLAARAVPKSRADAEAECLAQANAIAERIAQSAAAQRQRLSANK
jgi:hypothetical protein